MARVDGTSGLVIAGPDEVDWLWELEPDAVLSFFPRAWPAETWVLHGMWEAPDADPDAALDPGLRHSGLVVTQAPGFASPPAGWRRLRWHELAERLGEPLEGSYGDRPVPPCFRWFSPASWPDDIRPPGEGSLDMPTGDRLVSVLADVTAGGMDAPCGVFYSGAGWPFGEWSPLTLRGPLGLVLEAARLTDKGLSPDNIWPLDRSWLLTTDWDLWGTRVAGSAEVIAAVEADTELETVRYPYAV